MIIRLVFRLVADLDLEARINGEAEGVGHGDDGDVEDGSVCRVDGVGHDDDEDVSGGVC